MFPSRYFRLKSDISKLIGISNLIIVFMLFLSYVTKLTGFAKYNQLESQLTLSSNNTDLSYNLLSHHKIRQDFYISLEILLSKLQVLD